MTHSTLCYLVTISIYYLSMFIVFSSLFLKWPFMHIVHLINMCTCSSTWTFILFCVWLNIHPFMCLIVFKIIIYHHHLNIHSSSHHMSLFITAYFPWLLLNTIELEFRNQTWCMLICLSKLQQRHLIIYHHKKHYKSKLSNW
jgi:hypothetical protein